MELEKFKKAKKLLDEREELENCIHFLNTRNNQTSLEPIILYDGWPMDGNGFIHIPQPLANELTKVLQDLLLNRIEFLKKEFENI